MKAFIYRISFFAFILLVCCVEPYDIQSIANEDTMTVEGNISAELKHHQVKISRTAQINELKFIPETGAKVTIKDKSGAIFTLTEEKPGIYLTGNVKGVVGQFYTLSFTTKNGKQYTSEEVELNNTPPIGDIYATFRRDLAIGEGTGGVQIFLDTEDPTDKSKYYRWEFKETFEIKTPFPSAFDWLGGNTVVFREIPIDRCWGVDSSKNTILYTTNGLGKSKVTAQLIQSIPGFSPNLRIRYSILVRQFTLSKEAYQYWKALKDINESQGSLYDRQPGSVHGNISSLNDKEVVLGYFDAGVVAEKRVFFTPDNFSKDGYRAPRFLTSCDNFVPIEVPVSGIGAYFQKNGTSLIISEATGIGDPTLFLRPKYCCDCRNLGSNVKPSFWP